MYALSSEWRELPQSESFHTSWHDTVDVMANKVFNMIETHYTTTEDAYDNVWIEHLLEAITVRQGNRVRFKALELDDLLNTIDQYTNYTRR